MDILILGGTGVMGRELPQYLNEHNVMITSRREQVSAKANVQYICINAKELNALKKLLERKYDVIIDFMAYSTKEFEQRYELLLTHTKQYIFISSARVYAQSALPITEKTPRLLDVSDDKEYLATDEYALCKARSEDILRTSKYQNYTIVRPSITFGEKRLQLGVLEKEQWLYRALHGRSIVFSEDIASKYTTMTLGSDVAKGISALVGSPNVLGETFHITSEKTYLWKEILDCYLRVLSRELGYEVKAVMTETALRLKRKEGRYQIIYCRYYNRRFDNTKVKAYVNVEDFVEPLIGLEECVSAFVKSPQFGAIDWEYEAWSDRASHEFTPLREMPSWKQRVKYLLRRYYLDFLVDIIQKLLHKDYS